MRQPFFTVMGYVIGVWFCGMALLAPFVGNFRKIRPRIAVFIGSFLLFFSGLGWFGSALSAWGGLDWLPPSFEWPVGTSNGVIRMPGGEYVVPHIFSARVQVYDRNLKFLRGWAVRSYGRDFQVRPAGTDRFDVVLYRTVADTYLLNGKFVGRASGQRDLLTLPHNGQRVCIPTSPWLLVLTGPGSTWLLGVLGMATLGFLQWRERRRIEAASQGPFQDV